MSHHLTNHAWEIELRGLQKLVLLALSHLAVQSSGTCHPTVRRLAFMCGVSDSCVRDQLDRLDEEGYVERLADPDGKTVGYRVLVLPPPGDA
jgi:DNA-binding MarR family transcriptional regulator